MSTLNFSRGLGFNYRVWVLIFLGLLTCMPAVSAAQAIGEVEFARGVGFAQAPGQLPRTLGKGLALSVGDRLTTSEGALAIVKLQDGTRMTLRSNSELVLQRYQFKDSAADNSMILELLRGGLRAITGLISKTSPDAARIHTSTATIGIRGTDFDARLCAKDCAHEASAAKQPARPNRILASAKVVSVHGGLSAINNAGERRGLVAGGSVYPGDTVRSNANTDAVLAFRDESRITLGSASLVRLEDFVFDRDNPADGRFRVSLLRGSLRALTGLIAKAGPHNVVFSSAMPTLSIQGLGLDMSCSSDSSCSLFNWLGTMGVTPQGQSEAQIVDVGHGLHVGPTGLSSLDATTLQDLPRPDGVNVDFKQLFAESELAPDAEGLFVYVRDGHIEISTDREVLQLGRGEAGFAGISGNTARPLMMPLFLELDRTPMPNSRSPSLGALMNDLGTKGAAQCN